MIEKPYIFKITKSIYIFRETSWIETLPRRNKSIKNRVKRSQARTIVSLKQVQLRSFDKKCHKYAVFKVIAQSDTYLGCSHPQFKCMQPYLSITPRCRIKTNTITAGVQEQELRCTGQIWISKSTKSLSLWALAQYNYRIIISKCQV